ncbi:MAG: RDD family protein [Burkholderiales bacterium]|nr:RDD family protein [Burkholderiales bacterium]
MLDTLARVPVPEGFELSLRLAGPVSRALAFAIDFVLRLLLFGLFMWLMSAFDKAGMGLALLAAFVIEWFYPVVLEVWWNGTTPGKRAFGLVVLNDDGTPVGFGASLTRNLLRAIDFLPFLYAFGLAAMLINRDFKRLGDLAAGTVVAYRDAPRRNAATAAVTPQPAPIPLSPDERRAVLDFAERHASLTPERADELAAHAIPLVRGAAAPAQRLLAIAAHERGNHA